MSPFLSFSLKALNGSHQLALAAKHHSVPVSAIAAYVNVLLNVPYSGKILNLANPSSEHIGEF